MKLIDLVTFFRQGGTFESFCEEQALNVDAEVIEIYAREPVSLDAQLGFFPIEATGGGIEYQSQDGTYQNLFDFFYFLDAMEEAKKVKNLNDAELARKLFSYAINDA